MFSRITIISLILVDKKKYQEAIPPAERAVQVSKRDRGPEHPETAKTPNTSGFLFQKIRGYAKAVTAQDNRFVPQHPMPSIIQAVDEYRPTTERSVPEKTSLEILVEKQSPNRLAPESFVLAARILLIRLRQTANQQPVYRCRLSDRTSEHLP
jgi:hypothetical protein